MAMKLFGVSTRNRSTVASVGVITDGLAGRIGLDVDDDAKDNRPYRFSAAVFSNDCSFSMKNCLCKYVKSFIRRKYPGIISQATAWASVLEFAGAVATGMVQGKGENNRKQIHENQSEEKVLVKSNT